MSLHKLGTVVNGGYFVRYRWCYRIIRAWREGLSFVASAICAYVIVRITRRFIVGRGHYRWGEEECLYPIALLVLRGLDDQSIATTLQRRGIKESAATKDQQFADELLSDLPYGT